MATAVDLMDKPIKTRANPRTFVAATSMLPKVGFSIRDLVSWIASCSVLAIRSVVENTREAEENITLYSNGRV